MDIDWDNPVLQEIAKKGSNWFLTWWANYFGTKKCNIAFTGMEGVGKSVLYDYLTGKGFHPDYKPPIQSQIKESGDMVAGKARLVAQIVPGQKSSEPRYTALHEIFLEKEPVEGVIHVVSFGNAVIRNEDTRHQRINAEGIDTADKFRAYQREQEIADLKDTCNWILQAHHQRRYPKWMIVVIDKVDLFSSSIADARQYYSANSGNQFAAALNGLREQIGTAFFRWQTIPICAHLENLTWNKGTIQSKMTPEKRNAYVNQFQSLLETYFPQS